MPGEWSNRKQSSLQSIHNSRCKPLPAFFWKSEFFITPVSVFDATGEKYGYENNNCNKCKNFFHNVRFYFKNIFLHNYKNENKWQEFDEDLLNYHKGKPGMNEIVE